MPDERVREAIFQSHPRDILLFVLVAQTRGLLNTSLRNFPRSSKDGKPVDDNEASYERKGFWDFFNFENLKNHRNAVDQTGDTKKLSLDVNCTSLERERESRGPRLFASDELRDIHFPFTVNSAIFHPSHCAIVDCPMWEINTACDSLRNAAKSPCCNDNAVSAKRQFFR